VLAGKPQWLKLAREEFGREALLQNTADGVNREQAIYYHHEVADMMLLCGLIGRANGMEFRLRIGSVWNACWSSLPR